MFFQTRIVKYIPALKRKKEKKIWELELSENESGCSSRRIKKLEPAEKAMLEA
jgi:hypothetical protein